MIEVEQNSGVPRRKPGEPPRKPIKLTLAEDVRTYLEAETERTGAPMSQTVDRGVRLLRDGARWEEERKSVAFQVKDLCEALGIPFPEGLHLGDAIEKHIARELERRGII